jgi:hypothetical protein
VSFDQDRRRTVYPLRFREYGGLLVRLRKPGWSAMLKLTDAVLVLGDDLEGPGLPASGKITAWTQLFEAFADSLIGWDLLDRGHAVPATVDGVLAQDFHFLLALARTWYVVVIAPDRDDADDVELDTSRFVSDANDSRPAEPELDEEYLAQLGAKAVTLPAPELDLAGVT